jgi:predicted outer membrane repeat protein
MFTASGQSPLPGQSLPYLRIPGSTFVLTFTGSSDSFNAATSKNDNLFGLALLVQPIMRIDEDEMGNKGTKTQFLSNFAGDQGGGLFMVGTTEYGLMVNTAFRDNYATVGGGGAFLQQA